jgi:DUF177 domain-containing protein
VQLSVAAPAGLGLDVLGIPEGADLELAVRLESVVEGVLASGTARGRVEGECVRCLDPIERELEVEFQELFAYPDREIEDDEVGRLEDDQLDLEPLIRDAVVLALPYQPVCREDPDHRHEDAPDPRWAGLSQFQVGADRADQSSNTSDGEKE